MSVRVPAGRRALADLLKQELRSPPSHRGPVVTRADVELDECDGCRDDAELPGAEWVEEVDRVEAWGYHLDAADRFESPRLRLCRPCAVKLALRILDEESL